MQDGGKAPNHFDYELVKVVKDQDDEKKEAPQVETKEKSDAEEKPEPKEQPKQKAEESKEEEKEDEKDQIKHEVEARVQEKLNKTEKSAP